MSCDFSDKTKQKTKRSQITDKHGMKYVSPK